MPAENSLDFLTEVKILLPQNGGVCDCDDQDAARFLQGARSLGFVGTRPTRLAETILTERQLPDSVPRTGCVSCSAWRTISRPHAGAPIRTPYYGARIQPIFTARCITCHGADKHKWNLRLDSYRGLMREKEWSGTEGLKQTPACAGV